jgi:Cytochrome C and Quinol oxidase polypeptide I
MVSMIVPVFSRRPIVEHPYIGIASVLTGAVGFSVWLHHMFTIGMSDMAMSFFSAGSMTISIFTTVQVFAWVATMWKGKPIPTTAMLYAVGTIALLALTQTLVSEFGRLKSARSSLARPQLWLRSSSRMSSSLVLAVGKWAFAAG